MEADREFEKAIAEFNAEKFFECHETLENIWRTCDGELKWLLQGIIHAAVGFHHLQRGNLNGARRQLDKGLRRFDQIDVRAFDRSLDLHLTAFHSDLLEYRKNLHTDPLPFPKIH